jgi:poly(hydroxyalkanoate) granule-associated protein
MSEPNAEKNVQDQMKEMAIDLRNEAIVQSANLYLLGRKLLLAGLGAAAMTGEEASHLLNKLVERGELAEADARKLLGDFQSRSKESEEELTRATREAAQKANAAMEESVESILEKLNVPSKSDVDALTKRIAELNAKINELNKSETGSA